ncbi:conserved hypothetical protein [Acinetobacter sp. 8I-beige]|uniref:DUF262 domain-containing protein n=1 Tax=Acinetobacter sp. 8I-beige TaxID=2653125 RepID=UPI0012F38435|nr:DUF262 domain-containing protein [Acinetobacter sp. 8I-beige]VXA83127.1 conserved hypothetical protein [Acinetobacter sp. 8I-beige]
MKIEAQVKSIEKLKDYFFLVPDYQREYVWKADDQVEQFLTDIDNEYDENADQQESYFIGSIIIVKNKNKYDVIDGQQRLTTITLTLCAIRDLLSTQESTLNDIQKEHLSTVKKLLYSFDSDTEQLLVRLELQYEESKDFLDKLIKKEIYTGEDTASIQKMRAAYNQIYSYLQNFLQKGVSNLTKFAKYFYNKIELVLIESEDIGSALKIFETINQRGASLNAMDLVKNLLFRQANESQFSTIKETWKKINEALLRCGEDENPLRFLRYFMMARYHNGILREDDIYNWIITKSGKAILKYETHPIELVKEIEFMAQRYADLVNATKRLSDGSNYPHVTHIGFINKYKARQHLVMLLALSKNADKAAIDYLAQQIESFYFVTNTVGILGKSNEHSFANWVVSFRGKTTIEEIQQAVEKTIVPYVLERLDNLKFKFLNIRHDGYNPQYRQRFILGQLENQARTQAGLTEFNFKQIGQLEIEHIFPQTPKDEVLPEEFLDKAEYNNTIYKLGNVTLLESVINQAINKMNDLTTNWFEQKQQEYAKSNLLTVNLLDHKYNIGKQTAITRFKDDKNYIFENWSKQAIIDRQKIMLDLALDVWRFNDQRLDQYQFSIEYKDTVNA